MLMSMLIIIIIQLKIVFFYYYFMISVRFQRWEHEDSPVGLFPGKYEWEDPGQCR